MIGGVHGCCKCVLFMYALMIVQTEPVSIFDVFGWKQGIHTLCGYNTDLVHYFSLGNFSGFAHGGEVESLLKRVPNATAAFLLQSWCSRRITMSLVVRDTLLDCRSFRWTAVSWNQGSSGGGVTHLEVAKP